MSIAYKGDVLGNRNYSLWLNRAGFLHFSTVSNGVNNTTNTPAGTILPDTWYHVAAVMNRDTGKLQIYVNGVLIGL